MHALLKGFARHRRVAGKPDDYWLPREVYDPGLCTPQDLYMYIITEGCVGGPDPAARRTIPENAAPAAPRLMVVERNAALHAALVAELQSEYFADDLVPPAESRAWTGEALRAFFQSGGLERPS